MSTTAVASLDPVSPWMQLAMDDGVTSDEAAAPALAGLRAEHFLISMGDDTVRDLRHKADDFDSWIGQLRSWHDELQPDVGPRGLGSSGDQA